MRVCQEAGDDDMGLDLPWKVVAVTGLAQGLQGVARFLAGVQLT